MEAARDEISRRPCHGPPDRRTKVTEVSVVVTGGRGYLGRHVVAELAPLATQVTVTDITPCPDETAPGTRHLRGDVRDEVALRRSFDGADVVIHTAFAAPRAGIDSLRSVNVDGVDSVCRIALEAGVRRIVLVSSTIVDRDLHPHPLRSGAPVSQLVDYAASRREAEAMANHYGALGLEIVIVRPKTFVGPGRVGGFALVFDLVRRGQAVPLLGPGRARYQLVDVRDLASGVAALAFSEAIGIFGFGAARFGSVRDDLGHLIDHAGTTSRIRSLPAPVGRTILRAIELVGMTPLAEWHHCVATGVDSVVDISRAERELGWCARRSNAEALTEAFDWYCETLAATRTAPTTHPIPITHELLRRVAGAVLR